MNYYQKAQQQYDVAHYLLNTTYPAINDPKLLITILNNIHSSLNEAMSHLIGPTLSFREKLAYLQRKGFETSFIQDLNRIIELHKKSPIEFSRQGKFVICNLDYNMTQITLGTIENFLEQNKSFLQEINKYLTESNK